jgi:AdoMet-dependent heme synthase
MVHRRTIKNSLRSWITLFRPGPTARGVLPFLLGAVIAWSQGYAINWLVLLLSSLAVICIMLMTFLVNEYYDYETDKANRGFHKLSGGSRVLPMGLVPRRHCLIAAYVCLAIAVIIGFILYFCFKTGPLTVLFGVLAIMIGYFYTAGPLKLSYRGLGEIAISFTCGWLAIMTGYYMQAGSLNSLTTLVSIPGAVSIFLVILINEVPDIDSDRLFGKNNLAVRLGKEKTALLYSALAVLSFLTVILVAFFGAPRLSAYLSVVLLPFIVWNILTIRKKGLADRGLQEALSLRTMVFDHLITLIYAVSFVLAGLGTANAGTDSLIILAAAFVIVFGLEGLGVACSSLPRVKPFYDPPTLIIRQAASALYFSYLVGWQNLVPWLMKGPRTLPTAAGATAMGCIGFPNHPVWEVTNACNLRCKQCHASAGQPLPGELDTGEARALLDGIARIGEFRMLALAGGEPLVRPDIIELTAYARSLGLEISIATNGTLLTPELAREFKKMGVANIAIGLNANDEAIHDQVTGVPGSFARSKKAVYATLEAGMNLQINTTVMKETRPAIPGLLDFASEAGAQIVLLYQLVPEGRGEEEMELSMKEYRALTALVADKQKKNRAIIEPTCSPQYWAYLINEKTDHHGRQPPKLEMKLAESLFKGCIAGSGLCYVKPDGEVWPCPFVPLSAGNVHSQSLEDIWYHSELFNSLRDRNRLTGKKCLSCRFIKMCGGCRGRAYAHSGNYLGDDPLCFLCDDNKPGIKNLP